MLELKSLKLHRVPSQGFSIVELMVVVAIAATLAGLAAPSFTSLIADQRIKAAAGELHATLSLARSEAMKRSVSVTVTPKSSNWVNGWEIANPANANLLLDDHPALSGITITNAPLSVVYQSSGRINASATVNFTVANSGTNTKRCVTIDLSGRPTVKSC